MNSISIGESGEFDIMIGTNSAQVQNQKSKLGKNKYPKKLTL